MIWIIIHIIYKRYKIAIFDKTKCYSVCLQLVNKNFTIKMNIYVNMDKTIT